MKLTNADIPQDYARLRRAAYPDDGDQFGAAQKVIKIMLAASPDLRALIEAEAPDALAVLDAVDAVKDAIPKPAAPEA